MSGYEHVAEQFMAMRNPRIGPSSVLEWSETLPPRCDILDLGCGHGLPIGKPLAERGFVLYGVDSSPTLLEAYQRNVNPAATECADLDEAAMFGRQFEAILLWGVLFLLPAEVQRRLVERIGRVLRSSGHCLITAPTEVLTWPDVPSGVESVALGRKEYLRLFTNAGLELERESSDIGGNHYYWLRRPAVSPES